MKVYKVEKIGKSVAYYAAVLHSDLSKSKNHFEVFVKGTGPVKLSKKHTTTVELEFDKEWSYAGISRILREYGKHVCYEYCRKHLPCAEVYIPLYIVIANGCDDPEFLDILKEKTGFDVYKGCYKRAAFGLYRFPVVEFDEYLIKEHGYDIEKHGSQRDFVTSKWGKDFTDRMDNIWKT